jgi:RNA polymerase sigma factor (TIGR02999 family)
MTPCPYDRGNDFSFVGRLMDLGGQGRSDETLRKSETTRILRELSGGNQDALDQLMPIVYRELRRLARHYLRGERPDHTLQPTALVHEAFLRLIDQKSIQWQDRAHFIGISAHLMREILINHAIARKRLKRGGGEYKVSVDEAMALFNKPDVDLIVLNDALNELAAIDSRQSQIVELRFFGGLSVEETAEALKLSTATVKREWRLAKAWLYSRIKSKN